MRVGLLHFGQSVLFEVSITFLRSAVLAILAIESISPQQISFGRTQALPNLAPRARCGQTSDGCRSRDDAEEREPAGYQFTRSSRKACLRAAPESKLLPGSVGRLIPRGRLIIRRRLANRALTWQARWVLSARQVLGLGTLGLRILVV
jgi:hypothetical protein